MLRTQNSYHSGDALYFWKDGTVEKLVSDVDLNSLIAVKNKLYYWESDGIYCYNLSKKTSDCIFSFDRNEEISRFWASGHFLYALTSTHFTQPQQGGNARLYRYDLRIRKGESVDWITKQDDSPIVQAIVGDEALVLQGFNHNEPFLWVNVTTGSTRRCTAQITPVGYRDGDLILYDLGSDTLTFHNVETCEETTVPVPELVAKTLEETDDYQLIAAGDAIYWLFKEEYLLTLEEAVYQPFDPLLEYGSVCTLYRQTDESFEPVFEYTGYPNECSPYYQLMGDTFYFAFYGYPSDEYPVVDLIDHDPEQQEPVMTFAALKSDGTTYLLAEEYYPFPDS